MTKSLSRVGALWAVLALVGSNVVLACGDDDATPATTQPDAGGGADATTDTSAPSETGSIRIMFTYNGPKKGPVMAVLTKEQPRPNQPVTLAGIGSNENPTWPGTNEVIIPKVAPGTYYVASYIMTGAEHRQGPAPGDPVGAPPPQVTVEVGVTAELAITLIDIGGPPPDAGADAGSDGGSDAGDDADAN